MLMVYISVSHSFFQRLEAAGSHRNELLGFGDSILWVRLRRLMIIIKGWRLNCMRCRSIISMSMRLRNNHLVWLLMRIAIFSFDLLQTLSKCTVSHLILNINNS